MPLPTAAKNPWANTSPDNPVSFGNVGRVITKSDTVDIDPYAKAIVVTATGDLAIIPAGNLDAAPITFTGVPVGFIPPYRVRRVNSTGTTATCATVDP